MQRGFVTMAVGSPRFLEMGVDMALSLREHSEDPVALVADEGIAGIVRDTYPDVFDEVTLLPERFMDGRARKYGLAAASPFDRTAFIDADCIVLGSLDHAWSALESNTAAFVGELLGPADDENHHGFSTKRLMKRFDLDHYLKTNSGFFCFRTEEMKPLMDEMVRCFTDEVRPQLKWQVVLGRWIGDEIAIGIVGGRHGLGTLPKPAEMYWPNEFEALDLDRPGKPLLHWIWPLAPRQYDRITADAEARRRAHGVRSVDSNHWRIEQENLETMARRRRWLERLRIW